jgi:hypothetical protein
MLACARLDRGLFFVASTFAALIVMLLSAYAGAYFALSRPDYSFHEVGIHRTYRTFRSPTLVNLFDPMAKVEGFVTGDEVGLISPREGIAWDAVETGRHLR